MDLREIYEQHCIKQDWREDPLQLLAIDALQELGDALVMEEGFFSFLKKKQKPMGVYIYGGVGRGKTMLMDLFYDHVPTIYKKRFHFHEFIRMVHDEKKKLADAKVPMIGKHPIELLAKQVGEDLELICFDEFHIRDITDGMLLSRLIQCFWDMGIAIVATSNFAPFEIYKDGFQRHLIVPFLEEIPKHSRIFHLDSPIDYRLREFDKEPRFFTPANSNSPNDKLNGIFEYLSGGTPAAPLELEVKKRKWSVSHHAEGVVMCDFEEVCGQALAANDYFALSQQAHTILLKDIPTLDDEHVDKVKRFITLVDVLYDQHIHFAATAAAPIESLYTGKKEADLFDRTISRLNEMVSV